MFSTNVVRGDLLIATRNQGKVREFASVMDTTGWRLRTLEEFAELPEVEETGETFAENALLKARFYAEATGLLSLADDSGLEVAALGGAPGIYSARYGGKHLSDAERVDMLLADLRQMADAEREARFSCVIAIAAPHGGTVQIFAGACEGRIAFTARGAGGFGYDPVFVPAGFTETFGELPSKIKERISHRARALAAASNYLQHLLQNLE